MQLIKNNLYILDSKHIVRLQSYGNAYGKYYETAHYSFVSVDKHTKRYGLTEFELNRITEYEPDINNVEDFYNA